MSAATEETAEAPEQLVDVFSVSRRRQKSSAQIAILMQEFERHPGKWSIEDCIAVGKKVGLDRIQVSKWNWDHRKRNNLDTSRRNGQLKKSKRSEELAEAERKRDSKATAKKSSGPATSFVDQ